MNRLYSIQLLQAQNETRLIPPFQLCFPIIFEDRKRIPQFFASIHVSKSRSLEEKPLILLFERLWQFVRLRLNA